MFEYGTGSYSGMGVVPANDGPKIPGGKKGHSGNNNGKNKQQRGNPATALVQPSNPFLPQKK
jgi:hypothetical protein